jgi:hypothetical protein
MFPALFLSGHEFEPHLLHRFLTFYGDLIKWADKLAQYSQQASMMCLGQSCGPRASGRAGHRLAINLK